MIVVIMAGGKGTRFWPRSREATPKQFLEVRGPRTLLQNTASRLEPVIPRSDIRVVCSAQYVGQVREQLPFLSADQVIVEPAAKNTAPCIGLAALEIKRRDPEAIMAVFPADHLIDDVAAFHQALAAAEAAAAEGWLVTFAIRPDHPATGYGYLEQGEPAGEFGKLSAFRVERFTEKPDPETARDFMAGGRHFWNSGMFVWRVDRILEEIECHLPDLKAVLDDIDSLWNSPEAWQEPFQKAPTISIDFGVMEKASQVAMVPCSLGWNDVGNWKALRDVFPLDEEGIAANGPYLNLDSRDCVLYTREGKMVALLGVENLVVIDSEDALLVCSAGRTEEVKEIPKRLKKDGRDDYT